jgi:AcrR family transcriptional regulator
MMPRERVRRQPRAKTREELLDAAARVFARRGFHGTSVEAVSEEAGFSTGALYSNFTGKEELFLTLYDERIQRRRRELRETVRESGGGEAGLASAAANVGEVLRQDRDWFLLYFEFSLHAARNPEFARRFQAVRDEGQRELAKGLAKQLDKAGLGSAIDPGELAQAVRALSRGLALEGLVDKNSAPEAVLGRVLALIFHGLRAEVEADPSSGSQRHSSKRPRPGDG